MNAAFRRRAQHDALLGAARPVRGSIFLGGAPSLGVAWTIGCLLSGCAVGQGEGQVRSSALEVAGCVSGPFDLEPTFFASNPSGDAQLITLQAGDKLFDQADGVTIAVYETSSVRQLLGRALEVRLPQGVNPPGAAVLAQEQGLVALTLSLNESCHEQDVSLHAVSGTMTFDALFSGDLSDRARSERWIEGSFDVLLADPRELPLDGSEPDPALLSPLSGSFRFLFRQGTMAQPFP